MRIKQPVVTVIAAFAMALLVHAADAYAAKVITVEKLGGPEAKVNDIVAAKLETGTKVQFVKANGEVECSTSEISGKITENPEVGMGSGLVKVETWTFGGCTTTIGGAGGVVKKVAPELPRELKTTTVEGKKAFLIILELGVEIWVETAAKLEISCVFRGSSPIMPFENNNGELSIARKLEGLTALKNCSGENAATPNMKAKYRPLLDETEGRKGEQIFLN